MRILIAPDSYKECLGAPQVSAILADAFCAALPGCEAIPFPLGDGGEGTAEILARALGAERVPFCVSGPLGAPVQACYWRAGERALLDVASACGLSLIPPARRNPLKTSSRGVGELLAAALQDGCRDLVVGLGGSGTCDGGKGMMTVPGLAGMARGCRITALCDVRNPFSGEAGAARVFGPQKGAGPREIDLLEELMRQQARTILLETGVDVAGLPGAGAAGGLGGALHACLGAGLASGIDTVLDMLDFDARLAGLDLIVTGEGRSDRQTLSGKVPFGVLRRAADVPVVLFSGRIDEAQVLLAAGFADAVQVTPASLPLEEALRADRAEANLRQAVRAWVRRM